MNSIQTDDFLQKPELCVPCKTCISKTIKVRYLKETPKALGFFLVNDMQVLIVLNKGSFSSFKDEKRKEKGPPPKKEPL